MFSRMNENANQSKKSEEFYKNLKNQLEQYTEWPAPYYLSLLFQPIRRKYSKYLAFLRIYLMPKLKQKPLLRDNTLAFQLKLLWILPRWLSNNTNKFP